MLSNAPLKHLVQWFVKILLKRQIPRFPPSEIQMPWVQSGDQYLRLWKHPRCLQAGGPRPALWESQKSGFLEACLDALVIKRAPRQLNELIQCAGFLGINQLQLRGNLPSNYSDLEKSVFIHLFSGNNLITGWSNGLWRTFIVNKMMSSAPCATILTLLLLLQRVIH